MEFTNPHFSPAPDTHDHCTDHAPTDHGSRITDHAEALPRLRKVTNSPSREYSVRSGEVTPLSDNVAALICSFKGRAEVQRNGIKVERKELSDEPMFYWHEDSRVCTDLFGKTVLYVLNPNTIDCIHIMTPRGEYIETVPRKGQPDILDYDAAAREIAKHRRAMSRHEQRLQELHGEDTREILERHRENEEQLSRTTSMHPVPVEAVSNRFEQPPTEAVTPTADRIVNRGNRIQTNITDRNNRAASASALGHALRDTTPTDHRSRTIEDPDDEIIEDFTAPNPRNQQPTEQPAEIEEW